MAKFLNTSGTTYHLEELIKNASDRLVLISPYLKLNDRIKELLEDKNRLKIDIRIVYGKNELQPQEINWLKELTFIRTSFCKNLHAKCYLNETECIITSLNLYEFSQVNNNEMGVLINRNDDGKLYSDTYDEAQRIIRISDEVRMAIEKVSDSSENQTAPKEMNTQKQATTPTKKYEKLTTAKLATKLGLKSAKELTEKLIKVGCLEDIGNNDYELTELGKQNGGEEKTGRYGKFHIWDSEMTI